MRDTCPCCGQSMPERQTEAKPRVIGDAAEVIRILRTLGGKGERRELYRSQANTWHYTYGGEDRHVIDRRVITELVANGTLRRVYSDTGDAYWLGPTIDMDATTAERQRTGNRKALVYTSPPSNG